MFKMVIPSVPDLLVGWELHVPFQQNRLYWEQGLGWRFSSARLRCHNLPTLLPFCSATTQNDSIKKAHLSHYASAYIRISTQNLCISSM